MNSEKTSLELSALFFNWIVPLQPSVIFSLPLRFYKDLTPKLQSAELNPWLPYVAIITEEAWRKQNKFLADAQSSRRSLLLKLHRRSHSFKLKKPKCRTSSHHPRARILASNRWWENVLQKVACHLLLQDLYIIATPASCNSSPFCSWLTL